MAQSATWRWEVIDGTPLAAWEYNAIQQSISGRIRDLIDQDRKNVMEQIKKADAELAKGAALTLRQQQTMELLRGRRQDISRLATARNQNVARMKALQAARQVAVYTLFSNRDFEADVEIDNPHCKIRVYVHMIETFRASRNPGWDFGLADMDRMD